TGRGVDLIYQGLLRYGRPAPDYSRSGAQSVVVMLSGGETDTEFLRIVVEEERRTQSALPIDALIALALLRHQRRIDTGQLAKAIQRNESVARNVLERLVEAGLVEARGITKGRIYILSPRIYRGANNPVAYVRQAGFTPIQQEQMVLQFVREHGSITRRDVIDLCQLGESQASRLLDRLVERGDLRRLGEGRGVHYQLPS
ncbi:MAG: ATPase, partial [Ktedonobacterales bacterium]